MMNTPPSAMVAASHASIPPWFFFFSATSERQRVKLLANRQRLKMPVLKRSSAFFEFGPGGGLMLKKTNTRINVPKNPASETMNVQTHVFARSGTAMSSFSLPTTGSGRSGFATSHRGRRLRIGGSSLKLCTGGGELVAHSSVQAFHGFSPAGLP